MFDEGSKLFKVLKIHRVLLADEFTSSNTHNANFMKIWLNQAL